MSRQSGSRALRVRGEVRRPVASRGQPRLTRQGSSWFTDETVPCARRCSRSSALSGSSLRSGTKPFARLGVQRRTSATSLMWRSRKRKPLSCCSHPTMRCGCAPRSLRPETPLTKWISQDKRGPTCCLKLGWRWPEAPRGPFWWRSACLDRSATSLDGTFCASTAVRRGDKSWHNDSKWQGVRSMIKGPTGTRQAISRSSERLFNPARASQRVHLASLDGA